MGVVDKMQYIIESALIYLLEPRLEYWLSQIGILEAYVPAGRIGVLAGATTLASIVISGIEFLRLHRVPTLSHDRLLGRCQFIRSNEEGMIFGFSDLSKLSPQAQNDKLAMYNVGINKVVAHFLAHFAGNETFHLRPEVVIQLGAPTTALQSNMSSMEHQLKGYSNTGWRILETMEKLAEQEFHDVAETGLSDFEKFKEPVEIRTAVLKSVSIHMKHMIGATAHLEGAKLPIRHPAEQDLEK